MKTKVDENKIKVAKSWDADMFDAMERLGVNNRIKAIVGRVMDAHTLAEMIHSRIPEDENKKPSIEHLQKMLILSSLVQRFERLNVTVEELPM